MKRLKYKTAKVVEVPSGCLAITYYLLVILILGYLSWQMLTVNKLHETTCPVQSAVTVQIKGTLSTRNVSEQDLRVPKSQIPLYKRAWDASDIVFPPEGGEKGGFFIMTHVKIVPNQTRGVCPEKLSYAPCNSSLDCPVGGIVPNGHGTMTGACVPAFKNSSQKSCEIETWCPSYWESPEPFKGKRALLLDTKNFVLRVKNTVEYTDCGPNYRIRNINESLPDLKTCFYDPQTAPMCPVFRIGDLVSMAGQEYDQVAATGGVFVLKINWDCSFNFGRTVKDCMPQYSVSRMDYYEGATVAPGWNYWAVIFNGENSRTMYHRYGLKFIIEVEGEGSRFDMINFLVTIGAGIGLLGVAPWVCDNLLTLFHSCQNLCPKSWFSTIEGEDEKEKQVSAKKIRHQPQVNGNGVEAPANGEICSSRL